MSKSLRLLIVEVSEEDAELIVIELQRGGFEISHECVDSAQAMVDALDQESWDFVAV